MTNLPLYTLTETRRSSSEATFNQSIFESDDAASKSVNPNLPNRTKEMADHAKKFALVEPNATRYHELVIENVNSEEKVSRDSGACDFIEHRPC